MIHLFHRFLVIIIHIIIDFFLELLSYLISLKRHRHFYKSV